MHTFKNPNTAAATNDVIANKFCTRNYCITRHICGFVFKNVHLFPINSSGIIVCWCHNNNGTADCRDAGNVTWNSILMGVFYGCVTTCVQSRPTVMKRSTFYSMEEADDSAV